MKNSIMFIASISLVCGCTHLRNETVKHQISPRSAQRESYYDMLNSLIGRHKLNVRPKPAERDIDIIEPEKGGAGVLFGATMDDVIAIWGKPSGFMIEGFDDVWSLEIGACDFGFIDNSLVAIGIHSATLETAHFENGICFTSSVEEVKSAFGEPNEETKYGLEYYTENNYFIDFHFTSSDAKNGNPELINISIYHPDAGK